VDSTLDLDFTRSKIVWQDRLNVGELSVSVDEILEWLPPHLTDERLARLNEVVANRSVHIVSVLENIHDRGNVSAVMRSSEAFGFLDVSLIDQPGARFKASKRVTRGAEKWLDVHSYSSSATCVKALKARGYKVWATDLSTEHSIDTLDWTQPTAIVLGNEKDGITPEMRGLVDGCFRIPMQGFSQSFNISVAGALIYYRAHLEIRNLGERALLNQASRRQLLAQYYLRCFDNPEAILRAKM